MKQLARIRDTVYPPKPLPFFRECARGLIMDPQGRIGMIHIQGTDEFGIIWKAAAAELSRKKRPNRH